MQTDTLIALSPLDLGLAASLVLALAALSWQLRLGIGRRMLVAALRSTLQLLLLGLVLKGLFNSASPWLVAALATVMLGVAGYEIMARQRYRLRGAWGYGAGTLSMFLSSFSITLLALLTVLQPVPWYAPQYAIPLLGMLLGNTMNGIAVALDSLTRQTLEKRHQIEARLALGYTATEAIEHIRRDALRAGLIPIVNSMTTAGIVSLPGMMTGQILAGSPPMEAAKYQLLILFLIAAGTGLGSVAAVMIASQRLFDVRSRLRRERLSPHLHAPGHG
ncbi:MAG: iron export ABC transporter permease subunit FetB [Chromatiaceae bacterium]|nr:iron export ABC transporter permease subunit FetB [Chromatiaceae bacterium]